jgi:hypothetical protein
VLEEGSYRPAASAIAPGEPRLAAPGWDGLVVDLAALFA